MAAYKQSTSITSEDPYLKQTLEEETNTLRMFWKAGINGTIMLKEEDDATN